MRMSTTTHEVMRTADGVPLKISLQKALARSRLRALLLVLPLLAFVLVFFLFPIVHMLFRSVDNRIVASVLPRTVVSIQDWDPDHTGLPGEAVFEALVRGPSDGVREKDTGSCRAPAELRKTRHVEPVQEVGQTSCGYHRTALQGSAHRGRQTLGRHKHLAPDSTGVRGADTRVLPRRGRLEAE